jgi:hypothetical protein
MAQMGVGAVLLANVNGSQVHAYMKTARSLMGNEMATWTCHSLSGGLTEIKRIPDGAKPVRDPLNNPVARELASMTLGESKISTTMRVQRNPLPHATRTRARQILKNDDAQWSVRCTTKGVRVTRIA